MRKLLEESRRGMIIQTRYRDIPWEEIEEHAAINPGGAERWQVDRGRSLTIEVPCAALLNIQVCDGPHYRISGTNYYVCPHIAEIGD